MRRARSDAVFGEGAQVPELIQLPDGSPSDACAGRCVGMVGGTLALSRTATCSRCW